LAVIDEHIEATPEGSEALEGAFARFVEQTEQLREAYLQLKERAELINLELERANSRLEEKVRQLDELANFQQSILESMPTAVVVTGLDGMIRAFNPAAERMWGVTATEAVGRHFSEVMAPDGGLLSHVLTGKCRREDLRRPAGRGDVTTISSTACLVADSEGNPIGAVQMDRDISRMRSLEERLYQQEKLADLGRMAAGLAHEIRKPLNGIKGFASIMERQVAEDASHRRYIENIVGATDRLNGMLGRLLDFARPDELKPSTCCVAEEAERVCEFVRAEDGDCPVDVITDIPDGLPAVAADPAKIQQVLLNLVKNGVQAIEGEGSVTVRARLEEADRAPAVRVSVVDTGRGIPEDEVQRIFEPFYSNRPGGTGLGLAIVNRILQLHGTQLDVTGEPGKGTCMAFVLPVARVLEET
jgi:PAS domain S-box-containing protein